MKQVNEYHPTYNEPSVTIPLHEWDAICADLEELAELRQFRRDQADRDREYLSWSLNPARAFEMIELARTIGDGE